MSNKLWESVKEKCLIDYCGTPFCAMTKEEFEGKLQTLAAPTQSLLQRWLREEKRLILIIRFDPSEQMYDWGVFLETQPIEFTSSEEYFEKYELALEDAIKFALENLV